MDECAVVSQTTRRDATSDLRVASRRIVDVDVREYEYEYEYPYAFATYVRTPTSVANLRTSTHPPKYEYNAIRVGTFVYSISFKNSNF